MLSLLYPHLKYKEVQFHQDHIHPAGKFSDEAFDELKLTMEEREQLLEMRDMIPNLQLMEGRQNESKNATAFLFWLSKKPESDQSHFKVTNYIPKDVSLDFKDFKTFFDTRKAQLRVELKKYSRSIMMCKFLR